MQKEVFVAGDTDVKRAQQHSLTVLYRILYLKFKTTVPDISPKIAKVMFQVVLTETLC